MPRIRTIKPEFFRHEDLQDLEAANPGSYCMLVFIGLWSQCDNQGVFIYRPRQLKLDILPFLDFDMEETLSLLSQAGLLSLYEADGKQYGIIPTLPEHQRFTGKEAGEAGKKYPAPSEKTQGINSETTGKQQGSNSERPVSQEREREREREQGNGKDKHSPSSKKTKKVFSPPHLNDVIQFFVENGFAEAAAKKAHAYYTDGEWKDSRGHPVRNWKQKMRGVWFTDENRSGSDKHNGFKEKNYDGTPVEEISWMQN